MPHSLPINYALRNPTFFFFAVDEMNPGFPFGANTSPGSNDGFAAQTPRLPGGPPPITNQSGFGGQTVASQSKQQQQLDNANNNSGAPPPTFPELGRAGGWLGWTLDLFFPRSTNPPDSGPFGASTSGNLPDSAVVTQP